MGLEENKVVVDNNAVIFMQPKGPGGVQEGIRRGLPAPTQQHFESEAIPSCGSLPVGWWRPAAPPTV